MNQCFIIMRFYSPTLKYENPNEYNSEKKINNESRPTTMDAS